MKFLNLYVSRPVQTSLFVYGLQPSLNYYHKSQKKDRELVFYYTRYLNKDQRPNQLEGTKDCVIAGLPDLWPKYAHRNLQKIISHSFPSDLLDSESWKIPDIDIADGISNRSVKLTSSFDYAEGLKPQYSSKQSKLTTATKQTSSSTSVVSWKKKNKKQRNHHSKNKSNDDPNDRSAHSPPIPASSSSSSSSSALSNHYTLIEPFHEYSHLVDSFGDNMPLLRRKMEGKKQKHNKNLNSNANDNDYQTVLVWRDNPVFFNNSTKMDHVLKSFKPDMIVIEMTPTPEPSRFILGFYQRLIGPFPFLIWRKILECLFGKFPSMFAYIQKRQLQKRKQIYSLFPILPYCHEWKCNLTKQKDTGYLPLKPDELVEVCMADISCDLLRFLNKHADFLDLYNRIYEFSDPESYDIIDKYHNGQIMMDGNNTLNEIIRVKQCTHPHRSMVNEYRTDHSSLPITRNTRAKRILCIFDAYSVPSLLDKLTGRVPIHPLVTPGTWDIRFCFPHAYDLDCRTRFDKKDFIREGNRDFLVERLERNTEELSSLRTPQPATEGNGTDQEREEAITEFYKSLRKLCSKKEFVN